MFDSFSMFWRSRLEALTTERNSNVSDRLVETVTCKLADYIEKDDEIYREIIVVLKKHQLSIEWDLKFSFYGKKKIEKKENEDINSIKIHKNLCFRYVCLLDSSFALTSFLLLFINIIVISLLGIQVSVQ